MEVAQAEIQKTKAIDKPGRELLDRIKSQSIMSVPITRRIEVHTPVKPVGASEVVIQSTHLAIPAKMQTFVNLKQSKAEESTPLALMIHGTAEMANIERSRLT